MHWKCTGAFTVQMYIEGSYKCTFRMRPTLHPKVLAAGDFSNEDSIVGPLLSPPYPANFYGVLAERFT